MEEWVTRRLDISELTPQGMLRNSETTIDMARSRIVHHLMFISARGVSPKIVDIEEGKNGYSRIRTEKIYGQRLVVGSVSEELCTANLQVS